MNQAKGPAAGAHTFPDLAAHSAARPTQDPIKPGFQPLFRCLCSNSDDAAEQERSWAERVAQARQSAFARGVAEARQTALTAAQSGMAPDVDALIEEVAAADRFHQELCAQTSRQVIDLACAISQRILNEPGDGREGALAAVCEALQRPLNERYRLRMALDQPHLDALQQLCRVIERSWPAFEGIEVLGNPAPPAHTQVLDELAHDLGSLEELLRSALQAIA